jgi:hypothetical protein
MEIDSMYLLIFIRKEVVMKKLFLAVMVAGLFLTTNAFGGTGDITSGVDEVKPDVARWLMAGVQFNVTTKRCVVVYVKADSADNILDGTKSIVFQDVADDPGTPADETVTDFTDLVVAINAGSNIKQTITAAVKLKLGLP